MSLSIAIIPKDFDDNVLLGLSVDWRLDVAGRGTARDTSDDRGHPPGLDQLVAQSKAPPEFMLSSANAAD
jgi:hypothetical protein